MATIVNEQDNPRCVWCGQHMTPDDAGDWITCPNARDVCIDCCPCCGPWDRHPEDPLRGDPYGHEAQALRALIGAHPLTAPSPWNTNSTIDRT